MKKKILILGGGYSKERSISLKSAKAVIKSVKNEYKVRFVDPCNDFFKTIESFKPDVIFNALHGRFGEDGYIQSILEILKIKYTHSGVKSSMLAMDKEVSKKIFLKNKILTPKYIKVKNNEKNLNYIRIKKYLNYPVVVKPINEGSSLDVFICDNKLCLSKRLKKMAHYRELLIEKFIPGREIQVAIMGDKILGPIELKPKRKFYDYKAKYNYRAKTEMTNKINKKRTLLRKNEKEIVDICKILKKCDFEEISKYLIKQGKKKNFPDITLRE